MENEKLYMQELKTCKKYENKIKNEIIQIIKELDLTTHNLLLLDYVLKELNKRTVKFEENIMYYETTKHNLKVYAERCGK